MNWLLIRIPDVPAVEIPLVTRPLPAADSSSVTVKPVGTPLLSRPKNESAAIFALIAACWAFFAAAVAAGADAYVTSDLRHHPVQDAREQALLSGGSPAIVDVAHWASEWLWLEVAAEQLSKLFPNVQFVVSQIRTDPWDFVVTQ